MATKKYNYKDVDMLLASKTITQVLNKNLTDLSIARSILIHCKESDIVKYFTGTFRKQSGRVRREFGSIR